MSGVMRLLSPFEEAPSCPDALAGPARVSSVVQPGRSLSILHTIAHLAKDTGGTARCVPPLADQLVQQGHKVKVVTQVQPGVAQVMPHDARVSVLPVWQGGALARLNAFRQELEGLARDHGISLIHDHGVWLPNNHLSAAVACRHGLPRVVSVHGMLDRWSLDQGKLKKRLAWLAYQGRDLRTASLLHATADKELADIRALGLTNPVAVIPNGIEFPQDVDRLPRRQGEPRRALFMSRIHPKKGLLDLVRAWARLNPAGWELVIAGPDEGGYQRVVEQEVDRLGLRGSIHFIGPQDDAHKWECYARADLFVLPTYSENFGLVVAEALACKVPVVTTRGAPWEGLETHRCGWWTDIGEAPLVGALGRALATDDAQLAAMGERGRQWVLEDFSWERVAESFADCYRWLVVGGVRPAHIHLA